MCSLHAGDMLVRLSVCIQPRWQNKMFLQTKDTFRPTCRQCVMDQEVEDFTAVSEAVQHL